MPKPPSLTYVKTIYRTDVSPRNLTAWPQPPQWVASPAPWSATGIVQAQTISGQVRTARNANGNYTTPTSYSASYRQRFVGAAKTVRPHPSGISYETHSLSGIEASPMDPKTALNKAAYDLSGKIKHGAPNLTVALAEHRQTAHLLLNNATRVVFALRALKALRFRDAYRSLGINTPRQHNVVAGAVTRLWRKGERPDRLIANYWLELQYGWKPLYSDVYDSFTALHERRTRPDFLEYRCSGSDSQYRENKVYNTPISYNLNRVSARGVVKMRASAQDILTLEKSAFGINNPLLIAWELVPFSFVADWFIPIGNYLDTYGTLRPQVFQGTTSIKDVSNAGTGGTYMEPALGPGAFVVVEGGSAKTVYFERRLGGPAITTPSFKNPFSTVHVANALALVLSTNPFKGK